MRHLLLFLSFLFLLTGCFEPPDLPVVPVIIGADLELTAKDGIDAGRADVARITIEFEDGDGDLGLSDADLENDAYKPLKPNGDPNKYNNNFFATGYIKNGDDITPIEFDLQSSVIEQRFDRLSDSNSAIAGTLTYTIDVFYGISGTNLAAGDSIYYEVHIVDRELHESNVLATDVEVVGL